MPNNNSNNNSNNNLKLYVSYVLFNNFYKYLNFKFEKFNNTNLLIKPDKSYYTLLHSRLSTNFFVNQLSDMFTYELFLKDSSLMGFSVSNSSVVVYNLHNIFSNSRLFIFIKSFVAFKSGYTRVGTISEIFANSNWLEREIAELHGVQFLFKKDLRNLMLQYGDTSTPFRRSSPTVGFRETIYDILSDAVTQVRLDAQG